MDHRQTDREHFRGIVGIYCTGHLHKPQGGKPSVSQWGKAELRDPFTSDSEVWYRDVKKGRQAEVPPYLVQARYRGRASSSFEVTHPGTVSWNPEVSLLRS